MEKHGTYAIMQSDGNFVEYAGTTALWSTGTYNCCAFSSTPPWLRISDNGDLVIELPIPYRPVWQIGADPEPVYSTASYPMVTVYPPGAGPTGIPALPASPNFDNTVQYNMNPRE
jgi:hypothetical protein